jgi:hypothetical protein
MQLDVGAPHCPGPPAPQTCPGGHDPQLSVPPQPSPAFPQLKPSDAQVIGVHMSGVAQTFGVLPQPQTCPTGQVPQLSVPPQPSPAWPQFNPRPAHVCGTQAAGESGETHDARSNIMNSSSFSCGDMAVLLHSPGYSYCVLVEFSTWKSLKTTLPHWFAACAFSGVLNVKCMGIVDG